MGRCLSDYEFAGLESFVTRLNPDLTDISALSNLTEINRPEGLGLVIEGTALENLHGLENLEYIAGKVRIFDNFALESLEGFGSPAFIGADSTVFIYDNPVLDLCAVPTVCDRIESGHPLVLEDNGSAGECNFIPIAAAVCETVSTEEVTAADTEVYPNPVSDVLHFSAPVTQVLVYDAAGRTVLQRAEECRSVRVADLRAGLYFYEVADGGERYRGRFVKE